MLSKVEQESEQQKEEYLATIQQLEEERAQLRSTVDKMSDDYEKKDLECRAGILALREELYQICVRETESRENLCVLQVKLAKSETEIANQKAELNAKDAELERQKNENQQAQMELLKKNHKEEMTLQHSNSVPKYMHEASMKEKENTIDELTSEVKDLCVLQVKLAKPKVEIAIQKAELCAKDAEIERLKIKLLKDALGEEESKMDALYRSHSVAKDMHHSMMKEKEELIEKLTSHIQAALEKCQDFNNASENRSSKTGATCPEVNSTDRQSPHPSQSSGGLIPEFTDQNAEHKAEIERREAELLILKKAHLDEIEKIKRESKQKDQQYYETLKQSKEKRLKLQYTIDEMKDEYEKKELECKSNILATLHKPRLKRTRSSKRIKQALSGVEVIDSTTVKITSSSQSFLWKDYGFNLHIPQDSLPADIDQCQLHIIASVAGQYQFPDNHELVSGVYWVRPEPPCRFKQPLTVELQHCAKMTNSTKLSFVRAVCSQKSLPYTFKKLEGRGSFTDQSSHGSLQVDHFSGLAVAGENVERLYTASLYYFRTPSLGSNLFSDSVGIHLVVTWNNQAQVKVVAKKFKSLGATEGAYLTGVEFEKDRISLGIPMQNGVTSDNWRIRPLITPTLFKKDIDSYSPGQKIPCLQLKAKPIHKDRISELSYVIKLKGASEPNEMLIEIEPPYNQEGDGSLIADPGPVPPEQSVSDRSTTQEEQLKPIPHFKILYESAYGARNQWYNLGVKLFFEPADLNELKKGDTSESFSGVILKWLEKGDCTLTIFLDALKSDLVGCGHLCKDIEKQFISELSSKQKKSGP